MSIPYDAHYVGPGVCCCREEIASCSEKAYNKLSLADAQKIMMFDSQQAVKSYAEQVCVRDCVIGMTGARVWGMVQAS